MRIYGFTGNAKSGFKKVKYFIQPISRWNENNVELRYDKLTIETARETDMKLK